VHVVTGASAGIGRAIAVELASRGEEVTAVARSAELLEDLAQSHIGIRPVPVDLSTAAGRLLLVETLGPGAVKTLVHGAASRVPAVPYTEIDADGMIEDFRIHVAAVVALTGLLLTERGVERAVFIDSYSATTARPGWAAYSILKAAAQMAAVAVGQEHPDLTVLRLFPGAVRTGLLDAVLAADPSPARETDCTLEAEGAIAETSDIGRWAVDVLLDSSGVSREVHYRPGE
jgi:short-subunit dehydrogenase